MKKLNIIYGALIFVFLLSMCSCGARKSTVDKSKEQTEINTTDNSTKESVTETNVKETTMVKVDDKNQTITEETTLEPADNTKESFVIEKDGTKTVLNNAKKTVRKTTKNNNTATIKESLIVENKKEAVNEQKEAERKEVSKKEIKSKQVDKKQFNPFVSIVIGLFGLLFLWCVYRFYKKLPLVTKL